MNPYDADNWQEVQSSNIAGVGTRDHYLIVKFRTGATYRYPNMALEYDNLVSSKSIGKYFAQNIKSKSETYERLPSEIEGWPEDNHSLGSL